MANQQKKTLYVLHGNIGSGKSTLIDYLEKINYSVKKEDFNTPEFVQALNDIYDNVPDSHFELQKLIINYWKNFIYQYDFNCNKLILDRSAYDSILFIIVNKNQFTDYQYEYLHQKLRELEQEIYANFDSVKNIYIKTSPMVSKIRSDMRLDNIRQISLEYLDKLDKIHDTFFKDSCDLMVTNNIDGNMLYVQEVENFIIQN